MIDTGSSLCYDNNKLVVMYNK